MITSGRYRIALLKDTDPRAFEKEMLEVHFENPQIMQLTRVTRGLTHALLRREGDFPVYEWEVTVDSMNNVPYDYRQNIERAQEAIASSGLLIGVDACVKAGS